MLAKTAYGVKPKGGKLRAMLVVLMYFGSTFVALLLTTIFAYFVIEPLDIATMEYLMSKSWGNVIMTMVTNLAFIPVMFACRRLLRMFMDRRLNLAMTELYVLVVVSQVVMMVILVVLLNGESGAEVLPVLVPLGFALTLSADIGFAFGMSKQRQMQALKEQARQAEASLNLQTEYYDRLQNNILEINQIRHDMNNQLQTAYHLFRRGETGEAEKQLDQLNAALHDHVGPAYCNNLVADAVLSEKAADCVGKGIRMTITAELPSQLSISNAYLCSAFSNIMDNAISGASACGSAEKYVELEANMHMGYLVIRCKNSADTAAIRRKSNESVMRRHGLGLDILSAIARAYDGELLTQAEGGVFTATLMLRCQAE